MVNMGRSQEFSDGAWTQRDHDVLHARMMEDERFDKNFDPDWDADNYGIGRDRDE